jgi:hypothetical protein
MINDTYINMLTVISFLKLKENDDIIIKVLKI